MPQHQVELTNHLKAFRQRAGLTQAELAAKVNVTRKTINTVENQVFIPSTVLAMRLARVFHVSVEDLFSLNDK